MTLSRTLTLACLIAALSLLTSCAPQVKNTPPLSPSSTSAPTAAPSPTTAATPTLAPSATAAPTETAPAPADTPASVPPLSGECAAFTEPVGFSPDGTVLYLRGSSGVQAFDVDKQVEVKVFTGPGGVKVDKAAVSDDGLQMALAFDDYTILRMNTAENKVTGILTGFTGRVTALKFSADGKRLAAASLDGAVQVWEQSEQPVMAFKPGGGAVLGLGLSADGALLATVAFEGPAFVWELQNGKKLAELRAPSGGNDGANADFNFDSSEVVVAYGGGPARVFALPGGGEIWSSGNYAADFSPVDYNIAYSSTLDDGSFSVMVRESGGANYTAVRDGFSTLVSRIVFSPDGTRVAASSDGELIVFQADPSAAVVYERKFECR